MQHNINKKHNEYNPHIRILIRRGLFQHYQVELHLWKGGFSHQGDSNEWTMHAQQFVCHHIFKRRDCSSDAWLELAAFLTFSENTNVLFLIGCFRVICTTLSKSKGKAEAPRQFQDDRDKAEQVHRNAKEWAAVKETYTDKPNRNGSNE